MSKTTLFDEQYTRRKRDLLHQVVERLRPIYTPEEAAALRIDPVDPGVLSQRSGRGFVNRDILETVLGNLLECVAPGSHNAVDQHDEKSALTSAFSELADQLYAMIAQSFQAVEEVEDLEEKSLVSTFALLWSLPELKARSMWNRFAALKDPAVWDAYLMHRCGLAPEALSKLDFGVQVDETIKRRDLDYYRSFLGELGNSFILSYQMQLVMSTYPGWRVLLYHEIANALTKTGPVPDNAALGERMPVPLLPRAIAELGARYYQADIHPETEIGDANFLDHTHRGLTTGQTGVIGHGCHIMPCTLGGLTRRLKRRHPVIGNYVIIGTDADLMGPVCIGDRSIIGPSTQVYGLVETGPDCRIGSSVVIGTVKSGETKPGRILIGSGVHVGDGTIIENRSELDLVIPDQAQIPALSHITNDGNSNPRFVR
jgi:serine acetyltransferase